MNLFQSQKQVRVCVRVCVCVRVRVWMCNFVCAGELQMQGTGGMQIASMLLVMSRVKAV